MMLRESAADSRIVSLALGLGSRRHLLLGTTLIGLPDQVPTEQSPQRRTGSAHQCHQPGTLSDCVRRLEKELGVRLLNRTTRGLTPTEIGARLLERLRPALDEINTALNDLQEDPQNPAGSLRLHVPGVIARHILPQLLDDFLARTLRLAPEGRLVSSSQDLLIAAACAGHGILYTFEEYIAAHLASGQLQPFMQDWWQHFDGPYLYYHSRRHVPAPLRAFVDYVKALNDAGHPSPSPK